MTNIPFLDDQAGPRPWSLPDGDFGGFEPRSFFLGEGDGTRALEVAVAASDDRPRKTYVRKLWRARHGRQASPLLLVVLHDDGAEGLRAWLCGPAGEKPPVYGELDAGRAERLAETALDEPDRHAAIRLLQATLPETDSALPGLRNVGMFATHELATGVRERDDWNRQAERGRNLLDKRGRSLVEHLGFEVASDSPTTNLLRIEDGGRDAAVAVFLEQGEHPESTSRRFTEASPVSTALARADRRRLPFVLLTRGREIRVYSAERDVGVGRKGRAETFVEANLALLPDELAGYLPLIFGADALRSDGTFQEILADSRDFATGLSERLRERVYDDVVPDLATAIARRVLADEETTPSEHRLRELYETAMTALSAALHRLRRGRGRATLRAE